MGSDRYTWGIKDFHKCWSGSLAKRRLCLGPAGVLNCAPRSAWSFWVSLFLGTRGYNTVRTCVNIPLPSECESVILKPSRIISQHPWKESSEGTWRSRGGCKMNFFLCIYFVLVKAWIIEHANCRIYLKFILLALKNFINYGISHMEQVKCLKHLIASAESYSLSVSSWSAELLGSQQV